MEVTLTSLLHRAGGFSYRRNTMLVDGYWALEVVKGLEVAIETDHADTVHEREEWIEVLQRELQTILSHALNPKKNLPREEENDGN